MTQEKLASMSNVKPRTVQRAEAGAPISLDTLADIAEALKVPVDQIRARPVAEDSSDASRPKLTAPGPENPSDWITVRPVNSGRWLLEALRSARLASLEYRIEPTAENLSLLKQVIGFLEQHMPLDPWDERAFERPRERSLVDELEIIVAFNQHLQELQNAGFALFLGLHFEPAVMPYFDPDEGVASVRKNQSPEIVQIVRLVLADNLTETVKVSRYRDWPVKIEDFLDDEIPF